MAVLSAVLVQLGLQSSHRVTFLPPKNRTVFATLFNPRARFQPGRQSIAVQARIVEIAAPHVTRYENAESGRTVFARAVQATPAASDLAVNAPPPMGGGGGGGVVILH